MEEKTKITCEEMPLSIYEKLQNCRVELQNSELKKTGQNPFARYAYFELGDFLPTVNKIFQKNKLFSAFNIKENTAELTIINTENPDEKVTFVSPIAEAKVNNCSPVQALGAVHTYLKRYLYLNALEIVEGDMLDSTTGENQEKTPNKAPKSGHNASKQTAGTNTSGAPKASTDEKMTAEQAVIIMGMDEKLKAFLCKRYNLQDIGQLNKEQAAAAINSLKEKGLI